MRRRVLPALLPRAAIGGARREKPSRRVAAALLALTACTGTAAPPSGERPSQPGGATTLTVIVSGSRAQADPYLAGMRLAIAEVGPTLRLSIVDGDPAEDLVEALEDPGPAAILVLGPAALVAEQRTSIQADGRPVLLLGGDLYSSRSLFRQTFQTGIPAVWQARVTARYLARDRGYEDVLVAYPAGRQPERDAYLAALREEGLQPVEAPLDVTPPAADALAGFDAVAYLGPHEDAGPTVGALASLPAPPQLVVTNEALRSDALLPPGTVAPGHYAWAPWADPIDRVHDFRVRIGTPVGHEQEGYDAIRVLADALERTGGRTGEPLIRALERNRPDGSIFSALPVILGPDDHTLADESWIGLYAVPGPEEDREVHTTPWRPIIRTFTYDGERTIFREEDRTAFFPFWKPKRPSPYYFRSVLGIASRPDDPLH